MAEVERSFPLTRFFVVTSFLTTVAVTVATVVFSSRTIRRDLLDEAKEHAVRVVRHIQKDVQLRFIEPMIAQGESIVLDDEDQYRRLDDVIRNVTESFGIPSLYIFDTDGNIIYSTNREHVGFRTPQDNALYWDAVRGEVSSAVQPRGAPLDVQTAASTVLLETYVPVRSLGDPEARGGGVSNVIEAYQDIEALQREVLRSQIRIASEVASGALVLFLVLLGIVMRADRLIRRKTTDLVDRNEQLRDLSHHLEGEVKRRTDELIAREKLAGLGTLAAGLAHEVNNPLATISMCAQGLSGRITAHRDGEELDLDGFEDYLDRIRGEAFRVKNITGSLLDFSRRKPSDVREEVDIPSLVGQTLDLIRVDRECRGIDIRIESEGEPVRFAVDRTDVQQLVFNITRNAVDSIRERVGDSSEETGEIVWKIRERADALELVCTDNGLGVEPEIEGRLLEPFFTTKDPGKGTGLGLSLCHTMAERHGGSLSIRGRDDAHGAEVRVSLR